MARTPQQNRERRERERAYYRSLKRDPEKAERRRAQQRVSSQRYYEKNRDEIVAKQRVRNRAKYAEVKAELYEALGSKCSECGFDDYRALQVDHRNGGGRLHRRRTSSIKVMREMLKDLERYQILCANCHQIKTHHE